MPIIARMEYGSPIDYVRAGERIRAPYTADYDPQELRDRAFEYFDYMRGKVWNRVEPIRSGDLAGTLYEVPTSCPLDLKGFLLFAGFGVRRWETYKADEAYAEVCEWIEMVIETQNYEGAAVGAYNANLIARRHKITDRQETTASVTVDRVGSSPLAGLSLDKLEAIERLVNGQ